VVQVSDRPEFAGVQVTAEGIYSGGVALAVCHLQCQWVSATRVKCSELERWSGGSAQAFGKLQCHSGACVSVPTLCRIATVTGLDSTGPAMQALIAGHIKLWGPDEYTRAVATPGQLHSISQIGH